MARIDPVRRTLHYVSAGHPPGYILGPTGKVKHTLPRTGLPLGRRPHTVYKESPPVPLDAGDLIAVLVDI